MESSYGIGVKNRYELFYDDEEDPTELLRQQEEEKERRKAEKITSKDKAKGPAPKGVKPPVSATTKKIAKDVPVNKSQERNVAPRDDNKLQRTARTDRAVKFVPPGARENQQEFEERKNRRNREERVSGGGGGGAENRFDSGSRDRGEGDIRRGGGRGGGLGGRGRFPRGGGRGGGPGNVEGRGGSGGRGFDGRGKREYERQSGSDRSGVKSVDKKGGEGAFNWGTVNDDLEVQLSPFGEENATETAEKSGDDTATTENPADTSKEEEQPTGEGVVPDDAKEMTLDEYKREQEQKRSRASFNIRKPGEGEENSQWKKMFVLKKKINEEGEEEEEEETDEEDEYTRRGRQRQLVEIEINFADQRRGRGGRGRGLGRGGPGGPGGPGRGAGGPRGPPRDRDGGPGDRPSGPGERSFSGPRTPREPPREGGGPAGPKQSAPKVDDWNDFPSLVAA